MMKKIGLCLLLLILFSSLLFPITNKKTFSLPIRIIENTCESKELNRHDINLQINGIPQEITHLIRQERSLSCIPDLGRHFILSFHNIKGIQPIKNAISYLFTEILDTKDTLILLSPIKAYRIPITRDKEKMITDVVNFLDKDCSIHEKNRISAEKNLETEIQRLNKIASHQAGDFSAQNSENSDLVLGEATTVVINYKAIYQVLMNFPQNFSRFKNQYLLPDITKHKEVKELLGKRHGEKWWVHFHHREDNQLIQKAKSAGRKLNAYIATHETGPLARSMYKSLADLEKQLLISESIPQAEILDSLLGKNMSYNVVFWGSIKSTEADTSFKETSDLEAALRRIAEYSGGKAAVATDPEQGIKEIAQHSDLYYDLTFDFDGKAEDISAQVSAEEKDLKFSHKQNFSKQEVEELFQTLTEKRVEISDFSLHNKTVHFQIDSFTQNQENRIGMLKVRISLFDRDNTNIYKTENTLRASKHMVTISIPLPPEHQGEFRLLIEVFDLLENTSAFSEHLIKLD
jgi:hypothetical protein